MPFKRVLVNVIIFISSDRVLKALLAILFFFIFLIAYRALSGVDIADNIKPFIK